MSSEPGARRIHRTLALVAAAVLLLCAAAGAQAQTPALVVAAGGGPPYPARTLLLTAPGAPLSAAHVHIRENGQPVGGLLVEPLSHARRGDYGVVLVIDTSASMAGSRIGVAMAAARSLAAGLSGDQEIGVIEFNQSARVVLPLTADAAAITRTLAVTPPTRGVTHIFDAVAIAERELAAAKIAAGAVIVVSAGDDTGSRLNANAAAAAGRTAQYGIYTVAMAHPSFAGEDLAELATAGHGSFVFAEPSQLHRTLLALQARLTNRYVVHYRSLQGLGQRVSVSVSVDGAPGGVTLSYTTPSPPPAHAAPPPSFWASTKALIYVAVAAAVLLGIALALLLAPRLRREDVRSRVAHFTGTAPSVIVAPPAEPSDQGFIDRLEDALRGSARWQRYNEELEIARIPLTPLRVALLAATGTVVVAALVAVASGIPLLSLPPLVIGPLATRAILRQRLRHQRRLFTDSLPAHLQEIASAMRAGHSIISAIAVTADGASEPAQTEFRRVVADEQLGKPLHVALAPVARRMESPDISQLALVASVHERSGGNMAEVLDRLAEAGRDRGELQRELGALTAQARLSRYIVSAVPPVLLGIFALINPGYLSPLFDTTVGVILLAGAGLLVVGAYFVMGKIVEIEV